MSSKIFALLLSFLAIQFRPAILWAHQPTGYPGVYVHLDETSVGLSARVEFLRTHQVSVFFLVNNTYTEHKPPRIILACEIQHLDLQRISLKAVKLHYGVWGPGDLAAMKWGPDSYDLHCPFEHLRDLIQIQKFFHVSAHPDPSWRSKTLQEAERWGELRSNWYNP